ncbi:hypothetical protein ATCC90586_000426 [Pythium insidiosum]|nr:hypothetical protein ATCC90586_000426 [Pythium insidiosum]
MAASAGDPRFNGRIHDRISARERIVRLRRRKQKATRRERLRQLQRHGGGATRHAHHKNGKDCGGSRGDDGGNRGELNDERANGDNKRGEHDEHDDDGVVVGDGDAVDAVVHHDDD